MWIVALDIIDEELKLARTRNIVGFSFIFFAIVSVFFAISFFGLKDIIEAGFLELVLAIITAVFSGGFITVFGLGGHDGFRVAQRGNYLLLEVANASLRNSTLTQKEAEELLFKWIEKNL